MSQENVDSIRHAIEAIDRGDLDAAFRDADPDIVFRPVESWQAVLGGVAHGRDAMRRAMSEHIEALGPHTDRVVTLHRSRVRGEHSRSRARSASPWSTTSATA